MTTTTLSDSFKRILILEDDLLFGETLYLEFTDRGYQAHHVQSLDELSQTLHDPAIWHFAVVDLRVGLESGLDAIPKLLAHSSLCRIVILTGYGSIASAVQAVKRGAMNYLTKPVDIEMLEKTLWACGSSEVPNLSTPEESKAETLARHEREYIEYILTQCNGNVTQAAKRLGLHRQSLQRKLRKYTP